MRFLFRVKVGLIVTIIWLIQFQDSVFLKCFSSSHSLDLKFFTELSQFAEFYLNYLIIIV